MKMAIIAIVVWPLVVLGQTTKQSNSVDPEKYRQAMAELEAKTARAKELREEQAAKAATRPIPKRVVFILDATGTMMNKFDRAREEAFLGVTSLPDNSSFNVILFKEESLIYYHRSMARLKDREDLWSFLIKQRPHGSGGLTKPIEAAIALNPTEIWIVSDGDVSDANKLIDQLPTIVRNKHVTINTVLHFATEDASRRLLIRLALWSKGKCIDKDGSLVTSIPKEPEAPRPAALPKSEPSKEQQPPASRRSIFDQD